MYYLCIFGTLFFTVYGQLIIKWQVIHAGLLPAEASERFSFLLRLILNPWIMSSLAGAFLAFLLWMIAMTRLELSHAYPFLSLSFVFVLGLSAIFFDETISIHKVLGSAFIIIGLIVGSRG
jgi:drug/metabolite transporter (DMT)-like permease